MSDTPRIEAIRERLKNATPGPWVSRSDEEFYNSWRWGVESAQREDIVWCAQQNAEFIANAPDDMAFLLARLAQAERVILAARQAVENDPSPYGVALDGLATALAGYAALEQP